MWATRRLDKGQSPSGYEPPSDPGELSARLAERSSRWGAQNVNTDAPKHVGIRGETGFSVIAVCGAVVPEMWAAHRVILWLATGRATFCSSSELVSAQPPFLC